MFKNDTVINPPSSAWFNFYAEDGKTIVELKDQDIYNKDLFGLKTVNETADVKFVALPGDHLQFNNTDIDNYFIPNV